MVLNISATWAHLSWDPPAPSDKGYFGAVSYIVTAVDPQGNIPNIVSTTSELYINVTNLLPRINFQFHVQAVASALGVDNPGTISSPINVTTLETGRAVYVVVMLLLCCCCCCYAVVIVAGVMMYSNDDVL